MFNNHSSTKRLLKARAHAHAHTYTHTHISLMIDFNGVVTFAGSSLQSREAYHLPVLHARTAEHNKMTDGTANRLFWILLGNSFIHFKS
jgi:hypothetical protein